MERKKKGLCLGSIYEINIFCSIFSNTNLVDALKNMTGDLEERNEEL